MSAQFFCVLLTSRFSHVGCLEQLLALISNRVSPLAKSMPSMGTRTGSTHTKGSKLCFASVSNLPLIICRHLGSMVTFSTALTSHVWSCGAVASGWGLLAARSHALFAQVWDFDLLLLPRMPWALRVLSAIHRVQGVRYLCRLLTFYRDRNVMWHLIDSRNWYPIDQLQWWDANILEPPSVHSESNCLLSLDI